jgi:GNAT superfamily N-acetyltransferase
VKIRLAERRDVPDILSLIKELAEYEKAPNEVIASEKDIEISLFEADSVTNCHVAEIDGEVVAIAIWFLNYSTWLGKEGIYLEDLYVKANHRKKGIGLALMKTLAALCLERGYPRFQWWVLNWNEPSINFYEAIGAEPMNEWTVYRLSGKALEDFAKLSQR